MASNLFTELGCSNPIYPFVLLSEYRVIVCQPCQYACLAGETATHLSQKHADIDLGTRRRLTTEIKTIPNVLRSRTELPQLQYPPPTTEPISCLAPPKLDVLKCRQCNNFNVRQLQAMQEHYRKSHGWVNPRSIGRPAEGLSSTDNVPWIEGVACQRFFPSREGSRWFQVNFKTERCNASALKAKRTPTKPQVAPRDLTSEGSTHLQQVMEREAGYQNALSQPCITGENACRETFASTSLWLDRTQWSSVYRGSRRDVLWAMTRPPNRHCLTTDYILGQGALDNTLNFVSPREDEQKISCIMGAFDSVIDRCENTVRSTCHNTLCWLLSSRLQSRRESPFALVAEKNSEVRYRRTQKQFLAFVFRLYRMASGVRQDVTEAKVRPEIYAELDRIWNHNIWCLFEISKGTWPAIERQEDNPTGPSPTTSGVLSINDASDATVHDDRRTCATESEEDEEGGNADVEDWDPDEDDDNDDDSEDDDSEDENDCDDSGYWSNIDGPSATPYREMSAGVLRGSTKVVFDEFLEILFQLCVTLCTETFVDGQPSSTLLVYFSGVLGFSADCHRFQLARQYCPKLSAIIYMQRILLLELALPMREYTTIGIPQRPRAAQFESLNRIRAKYMVLGSQYPLAELVSLRDFGRNVARTEPPSVLFHWSSDGEIVSHTSLQITMNEFRRLPEHFISRAEVLCEKLMFGLQLDVDLSSIKDDMASSKSGYNFVKHPENVLDSAYLELLLRAYTAGKDGLAKDGLWRWHSVAAYLKQVTEMEEQLAGGLYTACGQTPRIRELLSLEYENGLSTSGGIYVWGGYVAYVIRHHKAKRLTNREFYVARFLPVRLGHVLFKYLVYIRRTADLLHRERFGIDQSHQCQSQTRLLFHCSGRPWPTSRLTNVLTKATLEVWRQAVNARMYRQLAIAVTEKHVREVYTPFNRYDDCSSDADINVVFAWQSGHRPLQRGITYGLDGAYPFRLQPSLLRAYEWASIRWHGFLRLSSKTLPSVPEESPVALKPFPANRKRAITEVIADHPFTTDEVHSAKRQEGSRPLITSSEQNLQSLPIERWEDSQDQVLPAICSEVPLPAVHDGNRHSVFTNGVFYVLGEPRILICLLCRQAVRPGRGIETHFRNMHKYTGDKLKAVLSFCDKQGFQDPTKVPLPANGSKAIPQLPKLGGFSCDYCEFLSIDKSNLRRHCSRCKPQDRKAGEKGWKHVILQRFVKGSSVQYWIVE